MCCDGFLFRLSRTKNKVSLEGAKHTHTHTVSATVVSNSAEAGPSQNSYDGYNSEDEYDPLKGAEMDWAEVSHYNYKPELP